jgi:hypothetical protein
MQGLGKACTFLAMVWMTGVTGGAHGRQVLFISSSSTNSVGVYDARTGATINSNFITSNQGLNLPGILAVDNNNRLYVVSEGTVGFEPPEIIGQYNATTGATINANLLSPSRFVFGLVADNQNHLFAANYFAGLWQYDATTGAANQSFSHAFYDTNGLAIDGNGHLFVASYNQGLVAEVDSTTGMFINSALVTGLGFGTVGSVDARNHLFASHSPNGYNPILGEYDATTGAPINANLPFIGAPIFDDNNHFFVLNGSAVAEYDATTGTLINPSFITGLISPRDIVFMAPVPEPSSLLLTSAVTAIAWHRRRSRSAA